LRKGDWRARYEGPLSHSLMGKSLLLIGYGAIGRALTPMGRSFRMTVKAVKRGLVAAPELDGLGTEADLLQMLSEADAVIVSLPGSQAAKGLIGGDAFEAMKKGVLFVNVGRGAAVDEDAFYHAMGSGKIGAAGIDTWWRYPTSEAERTRTAPSRHALDEFENLVMSPHRASHCLGRETLRIDALIEILKSISAGAPINVVDRELGY
jgi:phosphoglycerate dehydrogenase-like enzyme